MKTIIVAISNSDDKLPQAPWFDFCCAVDEAVASAADRVRLSGYSPSRSPGRDAAWVFELPTEREGLLRESLAVAAYAFEQDSIAYAVLNPVEYIRPWKEDADGVG